MRPKLKVLLASPRGFCAGVDRAIQIVERAIEKYGAPVYVRHEIVHNRHVVDRLRAVGAVFVEELEECPDDRPVVFSAHGVPKSVPAEATRREMIYLDATCPLVSKVHVEAERHHAAGREIVLIGHDGHPEVVGTMGQLPPGAVTLLQNVEEAEAFVPRDAANLAFVTQTTLSLEDTAEMVGALRRRFPEIAAPHKDDICYATTNRQAAVRAIATESDLVLVAGSANSSNSVRLVETCERAGTPAHLIDGAEDIQLEWLTGVSTIGLTAGASAPPAVVDEIISALSGLGALTVTERVTTTESIRFGLPKEVRQ
jgi:4-hydroxy-3-methylbut-2-enyl diphosphate reductase